jgi:hypothetical protein
MEKETNNETMNGPSQEKIDSLLARLSFRLEGVDVDI